MFVRCSKYRHVYGSVAKKERCYEGIRFIQSAHDGSFCAVNPQFLAVVVESAGGGAFVVLPLYKTGRVDVNIPRVCGHRGPVTDIKWNPFDDNVIASSSEDATIKLWRIPDDGLVDNLTDWTAELVGHSKKVSYIEWHPTAADILLSASVDLQCIIWNVADEAAVSRISVHHNTIYSISWNHIGTAFATTCKDRIIRVIDPRSGLVIAEGGGHQGSKASKVVFLGRQNRLFTTGFSKLSERQHALWDAGSLSKPLHMEDIDSSSGLLIPFFDADTNVIYVAGKGDANIRYFEIVDKEPYVYFLNQYSSDQPQRCLGMMPKRGVDTARCEVVRFYKLHAQKDICEPISMIVPRKSEVFQSDIYPATASTQPSLAAAEWLSGMNREPHLVSLENGRLQLSLPPSSATVTSTSSSLSLASQKDKHHSSNSTKSHVVSNSKSSEMLNGESKHPTTAAAGQSVQERTRDYLQRSDTRDEQASHHHQQQQQQQQHGVDGVRANLATTELDSLSHGNVPSSATGTQDMKVMSTPAKVTLRKKTSAAVGPGSNTVNYQPMSRLSRQPSDLSDVSTTTPVTPASVTTSKSHPRRTRQGRRDDSSSCSSTEALDQQSDDVWNNNPLYDDQRRRRLPPARRTRHIADDTSPVNDAQQPDRQHMTRSSVELHHLSSPPADTVVNPHPAILVESSTSTFKSEPDIAAVHNTVIIQDSANMPDGDVCHSAMIDCISVAAPDDTVIKPSQLRASMRQRRTTSLSDDFAVGQPVYRGGSLRETKHKPPAGTATDAVRKKSCPDVPSQNIDNNLHSSVSCRSPVSTAKSLLSPSSAGSHPFSDPRSAEATHKKAIQAPDPEILPTPTVSSASSHEANGVGNLSYSQLLHELKQLRQKYDAQQEEVMALRKQSQSKDLRIHSLEEQLQSLQSSAAKPHTFNVKGVW